MNIVSLQSPTSSIVCIWWNPLAPLSALPSTGKSSFVPFFCSLIPMISWMSLSGSRLPSWRRVGQLVRCAEAESRMHPPHHSIPGAHIVSCSVCEDRGCRLQGRNERRWRSRGRAWAGGVRFSLLQDLPLLRLPCTQSCFCQVSPTSLCCCYLTAAVRVILQKNDTTKFAHKLYYADCPNTCCLIGPNTGNSGCHHFPPDLEGGSSSATHDSGGAIV
jgi:hypothetical protein